MTPTPGVDARMARRLKRAKGTTTDQQHVGTADSKGLNSLPLNLVRDFVVAFLAPPPSLDELPTFRHGINLARYKAQLAPLPTVCKSWHEFTQALIQDCQQHVSLLTFTTASTKDQQRILQQAKRDGKTARQLTIVMGAFDYSFQPWEKLNDSKLRHDQDWWDQLFLCFPYLVRLDLSRVSIGCTDPSIAASSRLCPHVRSLELPCCATPPLRDHRIASLTRHTVAALHRWHESNGGLRVLTVPNWVPHDGAFESFIAAVASCCPEIEYLSDKSPNQETSSAFDNCFLGRPTLPLRVFTDFCHKCPKLREFSWKPFPVSPESVLQFCSTPRPLVEELELHYDSSAKWQGMRELSSLRTMVSHLPALRRFGLEFGGFVYSNNRLAPKEVDALARHIAAQCPSLEAFQYRNSGSKTGDAMDGSSIEALSRNHSLGELLIHGAKFKDQTLAAVLDNITAATYSRRVDLKSVSLEHVPLFTVLQYLNNQPAERFAKTTLEFRACGKTFRDGDDEFKPPRGKQCLQSRQSLVQLVDAIQRKHGARLSYLRVDVDKHTPNKKNKGQKETAWIHQVVVLINIPRTRRERCPDDLDGVGGVVDVPQKPAFDF